MATCSGDLIEIFFSIVSDDPAIFFEIVLFIFFDNANPLQFLKTIPDDFLTGLGVFVPETAVALVVSEHVGELADSLVSGQVDSSRDAGGPHVEPVVVQRSQLFVHSGLHELAPRRNLKFVVLL